MSEGHNVPDRASRSPNLMTTGRPLKAEMRFTVERKPPAGLLHEVVGPGRGLLMTRGFLTTEDGERLYRALNSFTNGFLAPGLVGSGRLPHDVDVALILCGLESSEVYVNPPVMGRVAVKRDMEKGAMVMTDDVADVERLTLGRIKIPDDKGVILLLRVGWRPAIYFDLEPVGSAKKPREYDIEVEFGALYARVLFHDMFQTRPDVLERMAEDGWFRFTALVPHMFLDLYRVYEADKDIESAEERLLDVFDTDQVEALLRRWEKRPALAPHFGILQTAARHYEAGDWLSAISVAQPRICRVLEDLARLLPPAQGEKRWERLRRVFKVDGGQRTLLLTDDLSRYVSRFFWRQFDPDDPDTPFSRNSVAHGAAGEDAFQRRYALQGFLLLDHLAYAAPASAGFQGPPPSG